MTDKTYIEVRWHGRGGQGAVTAAELVARAAINEGKYAQSFPSFGPERRGAPVLAFLRVSDEFIRVRANIYEPDIVVVMEPALLRTTDVSAGLKDKGKIIVNSKKSPDKLKAEFGFKQPVATVDASRIARETIKLPITNTAMIGALLKVAEVVKMDSLVEQLEERFGRNAEGNIEAMKRAYQETRMKE